MKDWCVHCEYWHVPGACAFTVKPNIVATISTEELQREGESDSVYFRRLYEFVTAKLDRALRDEVKAQDCVFLWSCGIRVDPDMFENKGNKGVDTISSSF